jgi:hypothetical protein
MRDAATGTKSMIQFEVFIRNGQIDFQQYDRKRWYQLISEQKDGEYVLSLKKKKKRRSNEQLRYLWGVVYKMISDETGLSQEDVHESMKMQYLCGLKTFVTKTGKTMSLVAPRSLSDIGDVTTGEMGKYIEDCRQWAAEFLGIIIPNSE